MTQDDLDASVYQYSANQFNSRNKVSKNTLYISSDQYLHELGDDFENQLSSNEKAVLDDKFCEAFFMGESWGCRSNINYPVSKNDRFDNAFQNDIETIEQIRQYLIPGRSLFVSQLAEINDLVKQLSLEYSTSSELQEYIEQLLSIKPSPGPAIESEPE